MSARDDLRFGSCSERARWCGPSPSLARLVAQLGGWRGARVANDQIWAKPPGAAPITFHRDSTYHPPHLCLPGALGDHGLRANIWARRGVPVTSGLARIVSQPVVICARASAQLVGVVAPNRRGAGTLTSLRRT
jgi:hypothetical protein